MDLLFCFFGVIRFQTLVNQFWLCDNALTLKLRKVIILAGSYS
jgi:hypothetical protein